MGPLPPPDRRLGMLTGTRLGDFWASRTWLGAIWGRTGEYSQKLRSMRDMTEDMTQKLVDK